MASNVTALQLFESLTRREKLAIASNDERTRTNVFGYGRDWYDAAAVINGTIAMCEQYATNHR